MQDFRKLDVWKRSHELTLTLYKLSSSFPPSETYGLTSQLRRAASSVPANIAEGCGRNSPLDFARFLDVAFGSASELEYHLLLARDLGLMTSEAYEHAQTEVSGTKRMLTMLIRRIRPVGLQRRPSRPLSRPEHRQPRTDN
jgi:four helix bundle protein